MLCLMVLVSMPSFAAEPVRIGILAFRAKEQTQVQWLPLARVLKQAIPGREFVVEAMTLPEMDRAVSSRQVDFVLTNSGHYVLMTKRSGLSAPLATLAVDQDGMSTTVFGGVIFSRADATAINKLSDLRSKTVAVVNTESLAAYQMQAYELSRAGISMPQDVKLVVAGLPQDNVVNAVLAGRAEIGFVRTGVLESMAREGKLDINSLKLINSQSLPDFPAMVSTRLYPEWPFSALPHVDEQLARHVAATLFLLHDNVPAVRAMGIHGFAVPADYSPVADVLRELRLPPYEAAPQFTVHDVWVRYRVQLISALASISLFLLLGLHALLTKRKLEAEKRVVLQQKQLLQENEANLQGTFEAIPDLLFEMDLDGRYHAYHSPRTDLLAVPPDALLGKQVGEVLPPPAAQALIDALREASQHGYSSGQQIELALPQGKRWFELSVARKAVLPQEQARFIVLSRDITARKLAEEKLQISATVFTHAREGITITDGDGKILDVNAAFTQITGYSRDEVLGQNPRILNSGRQPPEYYAGMWQSLQEKGHWTGEIWNRRKNGEVYAEMLSITAVDNAATGTRHYVGLFTDISDIKAHQQQLEHIAQYDILTDLPNRMLFADRLQQAMAQAQRRNNQVAVVYLDLDGFKAINDRHGHSVGDTLLIAVAQRIKAVLREGDTLARLGGDEFAAILVDLDNGKECLPVLKRMLHAAADPVAVDDSLLRVSASIGYTLFPQDNVDADQLLRHADQAMYVAKQQGKNCSHRFDVIQDVVQQSQRESLEHIRSALDHHEFVLYYQPRVNMKTGQVVGAEALIRWQHPERGLLLPGEFLPIIEDRPLGVAVGDWVMRTALAQLAAWQAQGLDLAISVNVAARQMQQLDFVDHLRAMLAVYPEVDPARLELEVLETTLLEDMTHACNVINGCRELGVRFALDDFGTGYSSLTYLKRLPADVLKIDQSFVRDMLTDPDDLAIVEGVLGLASAFRREAVAEGVETVEHGAMLIPMGCELAQGYGIARPMPAGELPGWIRRWQPAAAWTTWHDRIVHPEALPLLFAVVEHRNWIMALRAFLRGERKQPPALSQHGCRFGLWHDHEGLARYGHHLLYRDISQLHAAIHLLGHELFEWHGQGLSERVTTGLLRLDELSGELNEALHAMLQQTNPAKSSPI